MSSDSKTRRVRASSIRPGDTILADAGYHAEVTSANVTPNGKVAIRARYHWQEQSETATFKRFLLPEEHVQKVLV